MTETEPSPRTRALAPKLVVSLVIAGGFAWVLERGGIPLVPGASAFSKVAWWAVPSAILTHALSMYFRTCRWIHLLRPIAPRLSSARVLGIGFVGFTAIVLAPLRSGEVVRPYLLAKDGEVTFAQGLGATAVERIIDGLVITAALLVAMAVTTPMSPLPDHLGTLRLDIGLVHGAAYAALGLFTSAFVAIIAFYRMRAAMARLVELTLGRVSERLARFVIEKVERLADGLRALPSRQHLTPFLRDTALYYATMGLGFWATLRACGIRATLSETWVVLGVLSIAILVPAGPGFFGAFQLSIYCGLAMFFPEDVVLSSGAAYVFIMYVVYLGVTLLSCVAGFALMAANPAPEATSRPR